MVILSLCRQIPKPEMSNTNQIDFLSTVNDKLDSSLIYLNTLIKASPNGEFRNGMVQLSSNLATISGSLRAVVAASALTTNQHSADTQSDEPRKIERSPSGAHIPKLSMDMMSKQTVERVNTLIESTKQPKSVIDFYAEMFDLKHFFDHFRGVKFSTHRDPVTSYFEKKVIPKLESAFDVGLGNPYRLIIESVYSESEIRDGVIHETKVLSDPNPEDRTSNIGLYGRQMRKSEDESFFVYDFMIFRTERFHIRVNFKAEAISFIEVSPSHIPFYAWLPIGDIPGDKLEEIRKDLENV